LCGVFTLAGVGRILIMLCPRVTDIVYVLPPANLNLGWERWLTYLCPAMRYAVLASRLVLDNPWRICTHSGMIALLVSLNPM
jgi:hypothetical protein